MNREVKFLPILPFWIFIGIFIGSAMSNIYESIVHDVSFYDAVFIESWKGSGK